MTDATFKTALAFFVDDLEAARDVFIAEAESVASAPADEIDDLVDDLLEGAEEGPKDGFVIVEREDLEALRRDPYDVNGDLNDAAENFIWKFNKALRGLKAALVRETAS
jgi:hypothetical protein